MGKHNKRTRKEYLKRRRKRLKRNREEEVSEEVNKDDEVSTSTDRDSCVGHDGSENDSCVRQDSSDSCIGQDSSESEAGSDILQGCYLDPYDPEVERCYSYRHPKHDPLLAGFYRFQENKWKLLHLFRNPLGNQFG